MGIGTGAYDMHDDKSGNYAFSVRAAELPVPVLPRLIMAGAALWLTVVVIMFVLTPLAFHAFLAYLFLAAALAAGAYVAYRVFLWSKQWMAKGDQKQRGEGGDFSIGPASVTLRDSTLIPRDRIHRLVLRNNISNAEIPYASGMVIGGSGMPGAGMAVGSAIGNAVTNAIIANANAQKQRRAAVAYRVDIEYGGKSATLAGGLGETAAYGLMSDVASALGMR